MKKWSETADKLRTLAREAQSENMLEQAAHLNYLADHGHDMQEQQIRGVFSQWLETYECAA